METQKTSFRAQLIKWSACSPGLEWWGERTLEEGIRDCPRGDWLLWLHTRVCPHDLQSRTLGKGHCANTVRHLMMKESQQAVDIAIAYGEGRATGQQLAAAKDAAYAAYTAAADPTAYTAAAYAAAYAAAADAARKKNRMETANICREYIGQLLIDRVNELLK